MKGVGYFVSGVRLKGWENVEGRGVQGKGDSKYTIMYVDR